MEFDKLYEKFTGDPIGFMNEAADKDMNVSQYANSLCPEMITEHQRSALSAIMQKEGLFTRSSAISKASTVDEFTKTPARMVLLNDLCYRSYTGQRAGDQGILTGFEGSGIDPNYLGQMWPGMDADQRWADLSKLRVSIEPDQFTAGTTSITNTVLKPFVWDPDPSEMQWQPIAPTTPVPIVTMTQHESAVTLSKRGIGFKLAYEAMREVGLGADKLARMIEAVGIFNRAAQMKEFLQVVVNGDGREGTPFESRVVGNISNTTDNVFKQSDLKGTNMTPKAIPAGTLNIPSLIRFVNRWDEPYRCTHLILTRDDADDIKLWTPPTIEGRVREYVPMFSEMNDPDVRQVQYGKVKSDVFPTPAAATGATQSNYIIGLDRAAGFDRLNQTGANIREQARDIYTQTENIVMTDTYDWYKLDPNSVKILVKDAVAADS